MASQPSVGHEVAGIDSDDLFGRSDAPSVLNLPKSLSRPSDAVSLVLDTALSQISPLHSSVAPEKAETVLKDLSNPGNAVDTMVNHTAAATARQWPRASEFFNRCEGVSIEAMTTNYTDPASQVNKDVTDPLPQDDTEHVIACLLSATEQMPDQQLPQARFVSRGSSPLNLPDDEPRGSEDRRLACQFIRGLVALIREIRLDTPATVSASASSPPQASTELADHHPGHAIATSQDITWSTLDGPHIVKHPESRDEQLQHLDALEAARQARLALKDQFEGVVATTATVHQAAPTTIPASYHHQPQETNAQQTAANASHSRTSNPQIRQLATLPIIESLEDGKITLHLNGVTQCNTSRRLLYQTGKPDQVELRQIGLFHAATTSDASATNIVVERTAANYVYLIKAYHYLRQRKAELVADWKRQNPTRQHLLSKLPHDKDDDDPPLPTGPKGPPPTISVMYYPPARNELEPGETSEGGAVARRLFFTRGCGASGAKLNYVRIHDKVPAKKIKKPSTAIVLAETEDVYRQLAWFATNVDKQDWAVVQQPQSSKRKRPGEARPKTAPPAKKVKGETIGQLADVTVKKAQQRAELARMGHGDVGPDLQETDRAAGDTTALTQSAVMVLLDDG